MGKDAGHGPGEYLPDAGQGIVHPDDLPPPLIQRIVRDARQAACPRCGGLAPRLCRKSRTLHELGDPISGRPRELIVTYAYFHCSSCGAYFHTDLSDLSPPKCAYTQRVMHRAIALVVEDNLPYRNATWHLWRQQRVYVPFATIQNWVEAAGEKSGAAANPRCLPGCRPGELQRVHRRRRVVRWPLVRAEHRG